MVESANLCDYGFVLWLTVFLERKGADEYRINDKLIEVGLIVVNGYLRWGRDRHSEIHS